MLLTHSLLNVIMSLSKGGEYILTKTVTLRLEEELHRDLKIKMAQEGKTIQEYIIALIKNDMRQSNQEEK